LHNKYFKKQLKTISQIDIAPTLARVLEVEMPECDGQPIDELVDWDARSAVLVIVDGLGYDLYQSMAPSLCSIPEIASAGILKPVQSVSLRTSPAIASILCGLLPEHHGITDTEAAKRSPVLSIPDIASEAGLRCSVVMEKEGAMVYDGLIDFIGPVDRMLPPDEFDRQICSFSLQALAFAPRLLVSYFIGLDKAAHNGRDFDGFVAAARNIDDCIGRIFSSLDKNTIIIIIGDHPVHAGALKRNAGPFCVAMAACMV
jgi:arylsulfatase A-like enzyme